MDFGITTKLKCLLTNKPLGEYRGHNLLRLLNLRLVVISLTFGFTNSNSQQPIIDFDFLLLSNQVLPILPSKICGRKTKVIVTRVVIITNHDTNRNNCYNKFEFLYKNDRIVREILKLNWVGWNKFCPTLACFTQGCRSSLQAEFFW